MSAGVDRLEYAQFGMISLSSSTICTRRVPGEPAAYCGKAVATDYHPDDHGRKYMQHCLGCDKTYRQEHGGRCAVTV